MPSSKNIQTVKDLTDKLRAAKSVVFMEYRGVTASEDNRLRKIINSSGGAEYFVAKNRLFKLAMKSLSDADLGDLLSGPTSFILSYEDAVLAPRITKEFTSSKAPFQIKGGIIESRVVDAATIIEISSLPSVEVLISRLIAQLNAPLQRLHSVLQGQLSSLVRALNGVAEKKK